jgi:archaeosine synthase
MGFFFELLKNRAGFSRIGRINLLGAKKPIKTPNIVVPLNSCLMEDVDFIESFGDHKIFLISDANYIEEQFLDGRFRDSGFIFTHHGTLRAFSEIIRQNKEVIIEYDLCPIIPFNIPMTGINVDFARQEIDYYLTQIGKILRSNPKINFGLSIKLFEYYELFDQYISFIKKHTNIKILNFLDLFNNLNYFRNILETIIKIKTELDNNLVLLASGNITSKYYPLLVYLGFDLINSSYFTYLSTNNLYDTIEQLLPTYKIKYLPCDCLACKGRLKNLLEDKYSSEKISLLCYHNLIYAKNYIYKTVQYLHTEDFRSFVEKSSLNDLNFISILRILDNQYFDVIKQYTPLTQKNKVINCLGEYSYHRPDFKYFRKQTVSTFIPEYWTSLIILLPCSAKKPYSQSHSHQRFYRAIRKFPEFPTFQEIILTSPLGAIPRQLENIYPVSFYDISVTGDWYKEEIEIVSTMLKKLLEKYNKKIPIICHLEDDYKRIAQATEELMEGKFFYSRIEEHITSEKSLKNFARLIMQNKNTYTPQNKLQKSSPLTETWQRKLSKIIDYQFGGHLGDKFIKEGIRYKTNRFNTKMLFFDDQSGEKLGIFRFSTGRLRLTIEGAEKIAFDKQFSKYIVFDGKTIRGNTLFQPGIIEYPPNLLPSQNVCIFDKEKTEIIAMGNMIISSNSLKNLNSGKIVNLYDIK